MDSRKGGMSEGDRGGDCIAGTASSLQGTIWHYYQSQIKIQIVDYFIVGIVIG
jgi:hypothetical protein